MAIKVNGDGIEFVKGETISELLRRMNYKFPLVVVKVNGRVVPREKFIDSKVPDRAKVDIIHLTSGG